MRKISIQVRDERDELWSIAAIGETENAETAVKIMMAIQKMAESSPRIIALLAGQKDPAA